LRSYEECQFHAKSHELIDTFLACPSDRARGPPPQRAELQVRKCRWRAGGIAVRCSTLHCVAEYLRVVMETTRNGSPVGLTEEVKDMTSAVAHCHVTILGKLFNSLFVVEQYNLPLDKG